MAQDSQATRDSTLEGHFAAGLELHEKEHASEPQAEPAFRSLPPELIAIILDMLSPPPSECERLLLVCKGAAWQEAVFERLVRKLSLRVLDRFELPMLYDETLGREAPPYGGDGPYVARQKLLTAIQDKAHLARCVQSIEIYDTDHVEYAPRLPLRPRRVSWSRILPLKSLAGAFPGSPSITAYHCDQPILPMFAETIRELAGEDADLRWCKWRVLTGTDKLEVAQPPLKFRTRELSNGNCKLLVNVGAEFFGAHMSRNLHLTSMFLSRHPPAASLEELHFNVINYPSEHLVGKVHDDFMALGHELTELLSPHLDSLRRIILPPTFSKQSRILVAQRLAGRSGEFQKWLARSVNEIEMGQNPFRRPGSRRRRH